MKTVTFVSLLSGAGIVLIGIIVLVRLWIAGSRTVFLPGAELVISMGVLLVILTSLEALFILLAVIVWRT